MNGIGWENRKLLMERGKSCFLLKSTLGCWWIVGRTWHMTVFWSRMVITAGPYAEMDTIRVGLTRKEGYGCLQGSMIWRENL